MGAKQKFLVSCLILFSMLASACKPVINTTVESSINMTPTLTQTATPKPTSVLAEAVPGFGWWNDRVFYEIFVRSFYDSNGDGIGDFNGIIEKLDYLNDGNPATNTDLGITGIWLMPINPSPSYHGYDVTDYYAVNPDYGTMEDFKRLLAEAHKRGIKIIIDFVINHTSAQHPWFAAAQDPQSPYRDWYIWSDTKPNYVGPWGQQVWHPGKSGGFYYAIFWDQMPDLNYKNPAVTEEMDKITQFWLKDVGVDGFRVDAARHLIEEGEVQANSDLTHQWFQKWYQFYKGVNPNAMAIGEVWDSSFAAVKYVKEKNLDLVFDFDLATGIIKGVNSQDAKRLTNSLQFELSLYPKGQFGTFLTNHDMDRVYNQLGGDGNKARAAATILLSSPAVPFIYYGEEIGMSGSKPDEMIRTPMQWTDGDNAGFSTVTAWNSINADYTTKNVAKQSAEDYSLLSHYRNLIHLRENHLSLKIGDFIPVDSGNQRVYTAIRKMNDESLLIIINLGDSEVKDYGLSLLDGLQPGTYSLTALLGKGDFSDLVVNDKGGFEKYQPLLVLPANANLILSLNAVP